MIEHGPAQPLPTLIATSTTDGHTVAIAQRMRRVLAEQGHSVVLAPVAQAMQMDMAAFGVLVLGASVRYGKHQPEVLRFIEKHQQALASHPNAFFSVSVVARKPNKNTAQTNPYVRKFLARIPWQPQCIGVFAGKIDYPRYGWLDRQMIRLIMAITGGPTDPRSTTEFTDWTQVDALARQIAALADAATPNPANP